MSSVSSKELGTSPTISVVVPILNEEDNLDQLQQRLVASLNKCGVTFEIIYVDDGSADQSFEILKEFSSQDSRIRVISFSRNFGHQIAITAGIDAAAGSAVVTMDGDLQHPPELIEELLESWREGFEIVYTVRTATKNISRFKKITSSLFYLLLNRLSDTKVEPNTSDFRLLDRKVVDVFKEIRERHRFFRGLVFWVGFNRKAVSFIADERHAGKEQYSFAKMALFALDGIVSFSNVPLLISIYLGCTVSIFSFVLGLYFVYLRIAEGAFVSGVASVLVSLHFLCGIILIFIGVVGLYISRMYSEVKQRPLYVVSEKIGWKKIEKRA